MAPELLRGAKAYGPEIDVYSFGIIMWELLTCRMPWDELMKRDDDGTFVTTVPEFNRAFARGMKRGDRPTIPPDIASRSEYSA
jgi:serine/threonine protein kinase